MVRCAVGLSATKNAGKLMDCATIAREYGVSRGVAEAWMRQLPKVSTPDARKVWIRRADLEDYIAKNTRAA